MLKLKGKAKVEKFVGDVRTQGDGEVRGVTITLKFSGVKLDDAKALVGQLPLLFDDKDEWVLPEVAHLKVARDVSNVEVSIGEVKLKGADLTKIKITPATKRRCDIDMEVSAAVIGVLDTLHEYLKQTVVTVLTERQMELPKLEGGVAPEPGAEAAQTAH